jgi:hypothetical protein
MPGEYIPASFNLNKCVRPPSTRKRVNITRHLWKLEMSSIKKILTKIMGDVHTLSS